MKPLAFTPIALLVLASQVVAAIPIQAPSSSLPTIMEPEAVILKDQRIIEARGFS